MGQPALASRDGIRAAAGADGAPSLETLLQAAVAAHTAGPSLAALALGAAAAPAGQLEPAVVAALQEAARRGDEAAKFALLHRRLRHRERTTVSYTGKWAKFVRFMQARSPPRCPLPASPLDIVWYVGELGREFAGGRGVHPEHLGPYMAAINNAHKAAGYEPPAVGDLLSGARKGFKEQALRSSVARLRELRDVRMPLPADLFMALVRAVLRAPSVALLEAMAAVAVGFLFGDRASSLAWVCRGNLLLREEGLFYKQTYSKNLLVGPRTFPLLRGSAPHDDLRRILELYFAALPPGPPEERLFPCSGEPSVLLGSFLTVLCAEACVVAPFGSSFQGHSLRAGCATALYTVGCSDRSIMAWCGWRDPASLLRYVDRLASAVPEGLALFGFRASSSA